MALSRPRVCLIGKHPLGQATGARSYVRLLARAADRAGFEPHLFCTGSRTETVAGDVGTIHVVGVPWPRRRPPWDGEAPFLAPWLLPAVVRFGARVGSPLLIHGVSLWGWVGLLAARRLSRQGRRAVPLVSAFDLKANQAAAAVRGLPGGSGRQRTGRLSAGLGWNLERLWEGHGVRPFERHVYTRSRLVLVNYLSMHRILTDAFGPGVPVRRIPCTPESAFVHPVPGRADHGPAPAGLAGLRDPEAPLLVTASRHDLHKGLDLLLQALTALRTLGVRFRACLLSAGTLLDHHRGLAARLGLEGLTVFPGNVADTYPYLRHADVFVLPSRGEAGSGSLSLLEAMQAGAAIVSSACDGIPEDVTSGREALLVRPGRVDDLVDALGRVLRDVSLRRRLAAEAQRTFARRFSADALVQALGQTYGEVLCP